MSAALSTEKPTGTLPWLCTKSSFSSTRWYSCSPKSIAFVESLYCTPLDSACIGSSYSGPPDTSHSASALALALMPPLKSTSHASEPPGGSDPRIGSTSKSRGVSTSCVAKAHDHTASTRDGLKIVKDIELGVSLSATPRSAFEMSKTRLGKQSSPLSLTESFCGCSRYEICSFDSCVPLCLSPRKLGWKVTCSVTASLGSSAASRTSSEKGWPHATLSVSGSGETLVSVSGADWSEIGTPSSYR